MAKKSIESSVRGRRAKKSAKYIPDAKIDFSDIPELSDEQLRKMKRPGRPLIGTARRELIALRVDPAVLEGLRSEAKRQGKGYQTLINEVLSKYIKRNAA